MIRRLIWQWRSRVVELNIAVYDAGGQNAANKGYQDGGYDSLSKRVFLFPYRADGVPHGRLLAYSKEQEFTIAPSWESVDLTALLGATAEGWLGGAVLGGYVYLAPYETDASGSLAAADLAVRYNVALPIGAAGSYETHAIGGAFKGWASATHDGRYVYYCPVNNVANGVLHGRAVRYDTTLPFDDTGSWSAVALTSVHADAKGMQSCGFDGQYVHFAPFAKTVAIRYDTTLAWVVGSCEAVDLEALYVDARGYTGVVNTAAYVYYVPWKWVGPPITYQSVVARYVKGQPWATGWEFFDLSTLRSDAAGYQFGWTDARHVYMVPAYNGVDIPPLAFHDLTLPLNEGWRFQDMPSTYPVSTGGAWDGASFYTAPYGSTGNRGDVHRITLAPSGKGLRWPWRR